MLSDGALTGLALQARRLLRSLDEPSLAPFLADWPDVCDSPPVASGARAPDLESDSTLPVLRCLPDFAADQSGFGASLVADLCRNRHSTRMRRTNPT
jgi:hypothetical protein